MIVFSSSNLCPWGVSISAAAVWPWHLFLNVPDAALSLTETAGGLAQVFNSHHQPICYNCYRLKLYITSYFYDIFPSPVLPPLKFDTCIASLTADLIIAFYQTAIETWVQKQDLDHLCKAENNSLDFSYQNTLWWADNKSLPQPKPQPPVICGPRGCCDELPLAPVSAGGPQGKPFCLGSWYFLHCQKFQGAFFLDFPYEPCLWAFCEGC